MSDQPFRIGDRIRVKIEHAGFHHYFKDAQGRPRCGLIVGWVKRGKANPTGYPSVRWDENRTDSPVNERFLEILQ